MQHAKKEHQLEIINQEIAANLHTKKWQIKALKRMYTIITLNYHYNPTTMRTLSTQKFLISWNIWQLEELRKLNLWI